MKIPFNAQKKVIFTDSAISFLVFELQNVAKDFCTGMAKGLFAVANNGNSLNVQEQGMELLKVVLFKEIL